MKKKRSFKQTISGMILLTILSLIVMSAIGRSSFFILSDAKSYSFFSMLRYGLVDAPFKTMTETTHDIASLWSVREENDALKQQLEYQFQDQLKIKELQAELAEMKDLQKLTEHYSDYQTISAQVKNRTYEKWNHLITINKGSQDGVEVGQGVMASFGIIGRVIEVSASGATVSLVTGNDLYSQTSVKIASIDNTFIQGILNKYDTDTGLFSLDLLDANSNVKQGMVITTSGLGGIYPAGLAVGEVAAVRPISAGVGVTVDVKSYVDFDALRYVMVVQKP